MSLAYSLGKYAGRAFGAFEVAVTVAKTALQVAGVCPPAEADPGRREKSCF